MIWLWLSIKQIKTIDDNNIKHISLLILKNKFLNPICMWGQNKTKLSLYFGAESKYPQLLTLYMIWFDWLVRTTPKGMTIVCRSYVIGHKFIKGWRQKKKVKNRTLALKVDKNPIIFCTYKRDIYSRRVG